MERISPSQFGSIKSCSYKSILANALNKKPILPLSPNSYFGTVLHKVLERIIKENIIDESMFNSVFSEEINSVEDNMKQEGYEFFVPLQKSVQDFGMRKILLKNHIKSRTNGVRISRNCQLRSEQWISTKDNLVGGYVDLL